MSQTAFLINSPTTANEKPSGHVRRIRNRADAGTWVQWFCGALVVGTVLLSPLPQAGNHPLAWMFWATVFGASATLLTLRVSFGKAMLGQTARRIMALGFAFVGFAVFQALPFPTLYGGISVELPNTSITTQSLSVAPGATVLAAVRTTGYLIFFALVLFAARDPRRAKTIGMLAFYCVAAHGLFAIVSLKYLGDGGLTGAKSAFLGAATGAFINKNSFATFLGMGLILGLSLLLSELARHRPMRRFEILPGIIALGIIATALLLTQSRMGIAATCIGAACIVLGSMIRTSTKLAVVGGVGVVALAVLPGLAQSGFFDLRVSAQTRLDLYQQILGMIANRPLVGFGLDSFALAYEPFHAPPVTAEFVWDKGHSTYLTLWAETGVVFGTIPTLIGACAFAGLWRRLRNLSRGRSLALAGVGALVLGGVHSTVDFSLEIQANMFLLIVIVGLGLGHTADNKGYI